MRRWGAPLQLRRNPTCDIDNRDVAFAVLHQPPQMAEDLFRELTSRHQNKRSCALHLDSRILSCRGKNPKKWGGRTRE